MGNVIVPRLLTTVTNQYPVSLRYVCDEVSVHTGMYLQFLFASDANTLVLVFQYLEETDIHDERRRLTYLSKHTLDSVSFSFFLCS